MEAIVDSPTKPKILPRLDRLIFLPVVLALLVFWALMFASVSQTHRETLERARQGLTSTVKHLTNIEMLLETDTGRSEAQKQNLRDRAIRDVLLQKPLFHVWIESGGATIAGQSLAIDGSALISHTESFGSTTVHGAELLTDVMAVWRRGLWHGVEILATITVTVVVITGFLSQAIRQRTASEILFDNQEEVLRAVTESAAKLLNSKDPGGAIKETLATIGKAINVNRICMTTTTVTPDQRVFLSATHEWFEPGLRPLIGHPMFTNAEVTGTRSADAIEQTRTGAALQFFTRDLPKRLKAELEKLGQHAMLTVAVMIDGQHFGSLMFTDSSPNRLIWTPTEIGILRMLTEVVGAAIARSQHEEQQQKSMTNLLLRDHALENISQGITIQDAKSPEASIIYTNSAFAQLLGYPIEEIVGRSPASFVDAATLPLLQERIANAPKEQRFQVLEFPMRRKDGTSFLDNTKTTMIADKNGEVAHMITIHEDVTELRRREELLLDAQRMESVGQLTGGIAHDFNNLLTAIRSNAEDLRDDLKDNPLLQSQAEIVLEAADRGAGLVAQLMAFARKQELQPQVLDVNALLGKFTKLLRSTLPTHINIEFLEGGFLPAIHVDPIRFESAILNIAINARDAMPQGGSLTIETMRRTLDADYAAEHVEVQAGEYVLIAVTDTGSGMPRDILERAFVPFFTTKEVGKGTGLGLSMVYGFVKQSGGHARIYSEVGLGTVVKIYLPALDQAAQASPEHPGDDRSYSGTGSILLVEDDPIVRQSIGNKLTRLGYAVATANAAEEAMEMLKTGPHFDLVFSDVIMPGTMSGVDLIREVRLRWPAMKVLLTSGYTESTVLGKVNLPPDVRLLSKPYSNAELAGAISEALKSPSVQVA